MMTVLMDNLGAPSSRELVQRLYNKNIELENRRRKSAQARIPSDPNAWQQMRENYEAIILEDHAFSEQHEIEYALWQLHYRRIEELRAYLTAASQNGKGPSRPDRITKIRSQFKTFLSEATGFYHDLILKIRAKYGLPLGYFSEDPENQIVLTKDGKKCAEMKKGLMSCHRCLIYLGDLARYKGNYGEGDSRTRDYAAASSYYLQAASLWPSSGNPHHQLAILASYSGDDLVAIYRYFRSLAVDSPFSTARDNLIIAFEKNRHSYSQLPGEPKLSSVKTVPTRVSGKGRGKGEARSPSKDAKIGAVKDQSANIPEIFKAFCIRFVRLNGILFTRTSLETFGDVFSLVTSDLRELLSSGQEEELNFGSDAAENGLTIIRIIAILVFTVHNVNREVDGQSYAEILQRSVLLQNAFTAAFEFVGHILERCIQLLDPSSSFLLPGILVFVEWLACRPDIAAGSDVEEKQASARSFFWNQWISFMNKLMSCGSVPIDDNEDESCFFNMSRYDEGETGNRIALPEDFELRGFLPLIPAQLILDFSRKHSFGDGGNKEKRSRVQRIVAAGRALVNVVRIDQQGVYFDQKLKTFIIGVAPQLAENTLTCSEVAKPNGVKQVNSVEENLNLEAMQSKAQFYMEGEDEDEEIVFKPTVVDKPVDQMIPKWMPYDTWGPVPHATNADYGAYVSSTSATTNNLSLPISLDSSSRLSAPFANNIPSHLQPISTSASKWIMDQQDSLATGLANLSFVGNGLIRKPELQEGFNISQPPSDLSHLPQPNIIAGNMFLGSTKAPGTEIPSKFDSIMLPGTNAENFTVKPSSVSHANLRKSPVSRPVRHLGPPPGFSTVPPKQVDDPISGSDLKTGNPLIDDYSWLDGYHLSSTKETTQNSIGHMTHAYPHYSVTSSSSSSSTSTFPFPGKQVPSVQLPVENQKSWQEHLKLYQGQQHQLLQQGNKEATPIPEQYQGQSLWTGRLFV
ncbi:PREDICTED: protein SMG7 [Nelumbo nucifera]|uniref:Protein SMG7 n=1 Tax=Nelumbo nucifera TaxID=4432 RepID=A0A1U8B6Q8_NELNU|nr:PREDICTED: protein SMG7 [Nelumbo nucifera]XP_010276661.1 PREDICTED: protein SMG7 [Nelumbo nucifera]XP_010276662.1 PREDICTED: protein SMG7 [Nelumbo nucifera]